MGISYSTTQVYPIPLANNPDPNGCFYCSLLDNQIFTILLAFTCISSEYAGGGRRASASDDVYAFGIILLEMMTGRRPTDPMFKDGVSIVNFVDTNFPHQIFRVIDAPLVEESKDFAQANMASVNSVQQSVVSVLQVALSCTNLIPSERMTMKETASRMQAIQMTHIERESKAKN